MSRPAALLLLLGVAFRLLLLGSLEPFIVSDARDYHETAATLAATGRYAHAYQGEVEVWRGLEFRAFRPPGYPATLAAIYATTGPDPQVAIYANVFFDAITQVATYLLTLALFGPAAALVALGLLVVSPVWTPFLLSESLHTALFAVLLLGLHYRDRTGFGWGILAAAAVFVRPISVALYPVALWRYPARAWVGLLLPLALALGAWGLRNYHVLGAFVFATNGSWHQAFGFGFDPYKLYADLRATGAGEAEIAAAFREVEWSLLLERGPAWAVWLWGTRLLELLSPAPTFELLNLWNAARVVGEGGVAAHELAHATLYVVYPVALIGVLTLGERREARFLLGVALAYVTLHATLSRGDVRLFAPLYPVACIAAASLVTQRDPLPRTP